MGRIKRPKFKILCVIKLRMPNYKDLQIEHENEQRHAIPHFYPSGVLIEPDPGRIGYAD